MNIFLAHEASMVNCTLVWLRFYYKKSVAKISRSRKAKTIFCYLVEKDTLISNFTLFFANDSAFLRNSSFNTAVALRGVLVVNSSRDVTDIMFDYSISMDFSNRELGTEHQQESNLFYQAIGPSY